MARNFERSVAADTLGLAGQRRFMSDIPSKTSEIKPPSGFRPLSPHLPLYQPQLSSTLSICNRIAGGFLVAVTLLFYMIYMKLGLVTLTYDSFYQFVFYSSKLHLLAVEISALAMSYHLYSAIRHLFIWYHSHNWYLSSMFDPEVILSLSWFIFWFFMVAKHLFSFWKLCFSTLFLT